MDILQKLCKLAVLQITLPQHWETRLLFYPRALNGAELRSGGNMFTFIFLRCNLDVRYYVALYLSYCYEFFSVQS